MRVLFALSAVALAAAACQTSEQATQRNAALAAEIAARQGDEVNRVCFSRNVDGWRPLDRRSVLIREGVNDWYKLDLIGSCEPEWAFDTIAVRSRPSGSSCLTPGDTLITADANIAGRCSIDRIYEWDEDAPFSAAEETAAAVPDAG